MGLEADSSQSTAVTVVIPYFQREVGTLTRALASIAAQRWVDLQSVEVLIVDDSSPVPASVELREASYPFRLRVIEQANAGPGAARNAALNSLSPSTRFIAFLDSDDVWSPDHLAVALEALDRTGASFFFANHFQLGAGVPAFERAGRIDLQAHKKEFGDIYRFSGNMVTQILSGNLIGTSTVVYLYESHRSLRFRPEFRRAGEDYLMWLDATKDGASFIFRVTPSVTYREGVNIFSGVSWGTPEHLERTSDEIRFLNAALSLHCDQGGLKESLRGRIRERRGVYFRSLLSALRHSPAATLALLLKRKNSH